MHQASKCGGSRKVVIKSLWGRERLVVLDKDAPFPPGILSVYALRIIEVANTL